MKSSKTWVRRFITIPLLLVTLIFSFNFVIDPYSITDYNLLKIPNKFARDDRKEKVAKLYSEPRYENLLLGSSHVYTINPRMVSRYLGGRSYNAGVGTARIEDHLGFLLFLERIDKLPAHVIIGLDFYSFNQNVETNRYFLQNDDLNFLHQHPDSDLYFSKFLSIDALRASYKTLSNFLQSSKDKPRFDTYGTVWNASNTFDFYPKKIEHTSFTEEQVLKGLDDIRNVEYNTISPKRLEYLDQIISICHRHNIDYIFFITPLNGQLLERIEHNTKLAKTLKNFKVTLAKHTAYYDFLIHNPIIDNRFYFGDVAHTYPFTGNLILARLFNDKAISIPSTFGLYISLSSSKKNSK